MVVCLCELDLPHRSNSEFLGATLAGVKLGLAGSNRPAACVSWREHTAVCSPPSGQHWAALLRKRGKKRQGKLKTTTANQAFSFRGSYNDGRTWRPTLKQQTYWEASMAAALAAAGAKTRVSEEFEEATKRECCG